jgi:chaperonin GroES
MKLHPLDDRIVVRPGESEETTASGLVIPDTAKEKPQQGEILAVGPGRRAENSGDIIPLDVAVGDTVVYSKYGGTEITVDGEDLLILSGRDVLAKLYKLVASAVVGAGWGRARPVAMTHHPLCTGLGRSHLNAQDPEIRRRRPPRARSRRQQAR